MIIVAILVSLGVQLVSSAPAAVHSEQPAYSDEFARTKVVPLCAATELDNPQICLSRHFANATVSPVSSSKEIGCSGG
ncbi:unnamed protein product [Heligmosomoides polygyrus]|uniref:Thyroglobulin n=1 Tax=Heligmosomoides polygyrus TaxID=6339 RepID=A0A183GD85_HELPZ|nr:unnamed protein product [Heligmosomoides polygyrus]